MTTRTLTMALLAFGLTACATVPQYTSGADYLARSSSAPVAMHNAGTDSAVRKIAAVEPDLRFPARIGLARIERGRLVGVPADEAQSWRASVEGLGQAMATSFLSRL